MDIKEIIFKAYKDKPIISKKFRAAIRKDYKLTDDDIRDIFIKINNYQIKKYGCKLDKEDSTIYSKQEILRINLNARTRREARINPRKRGKNKDGE